MLNLKKTFLPLLLLLASVPAMASITLSSFVKAEGGTTSQTVSASISAGQSVAVSVYVDTGGTCSAPVVTDNGGNTYTAGIAGANTGRSTQGFYSTNVVNAATSITVTPTGTCGYLLLAAWVVDSSASVGAVSTAGSDLTGGSGATDAVTSGVMTATTADVMIFGGAFDLLNVAMAAGTGFTSDSAAGGHRFEHRTATASGAALFTGANGCLTVVSGILFQVGGPSAPPAKSLLAF